MLEAGLIPIEGVLPGVLVVTTFSSSLRLICFFSFLSQKYPALRLPSYPVQRSLASEKI